MEEHEKNLLALSLYSWYKTSSGRPLKSLFQLDPWGQKSPRPSDHMLYIGLYREKHEAFVLSETMRPRALIFGM